MGAKFICLCATKQTAVGICNASFINTLNLQMVAPYVRERKLITSLGSPPSSRQDFVTSSHSLAAVLLTARVCAGFKNPRFSCLNACRSAGPARACALALGPASSHLHPTDAHTRQEVAEQLLAVLVSHTRTSFRAACAESLGLAVASSSGNKASDAEMGSLVQIVECLLSMLCTLCPAAVNPVKKMIVSTSGMLRMDHVQGVESSVNRGDEEAEVVLGIMTGKQPLPLFLSWHAVVACGQGCPVNECCRPHMLIYAIVVAPVSCIGPHNWHVQLALNWE